MPQQQRRSIRPLILLTGLLMGGVALVCPAQGQSAPKGAPSAFTAANFPPAESYSYVFLDPLEGNHPAAKADDAQHQGIKLHGHWIIDVKNPDGTLAKHSDFENSLYFDGAGYLIGLLSGYASAGDYGIFLPSPTGPTAVCPQPSGVSGSSTGCAIVQSATSMPGLLLCGLYVCATGLTATPFFGGTPSLTLSGSITAPHAGSISNVSVAQNGCNSPTVQSSGPPSGPSVMTPAACQTSTAFNFTGYLSSATITPVTVVAGQIIQVTVVYTFS